MRLFRFFWQAHKWAGIVLALWLTLIAVTGLLLLFKKQSAWIQPPTQRDVPGEVTDFISQAELLAIVLAQEHPAFGSLADIDRIDLRPGRRVYKVVSRHGYAEIQVGAVSGAVLSVDVRRSDLLEQLHDGSYFGGVVHGWVMPVVAAGTVLLVVSGVWVWVAPLLRRRRR